MTGVYERHDGKESDRMDKKQERTLSDGDSKNENRRDSE